MSSHSRVLESSKYFPSSNSSRVLERKKAKRKSKSSVEKVERQKCPLIEQIDTRKKYHQDKIRRNLEEFKNQSGKPNLRKGKVSTFPENPAGTRNDYKDGSAVSISTLSSGTNIEDALERLSVTTCSEDNVPIMSTHDFRFHESLPAHYNYCRHQSLMPNPSPFYEEYNPRNPKFQSFPCFQLPQDYLVDMEAANTLPPRSRPEGRIQSMIPVQNVNQAKVAVVRNKSLDVRVERGSVDKPPQQQRRLSIPRSSHVTRQRTTEKAITQGELLPKIKETSSFSLNTEPVTLNKVEDFPKKEAHKGEKESSVSKVKTQLKNIRVKFLDMLSSSKSSKKKHS